MKQLKIYTRFHHLSPVYLNICREEWGKYEEVLKMLEPYFGEDWKEKLKTLTKKELLYICVDLANKKTEHLIKSITFGAMCLEAFIYDYAAHNFTDTYVKKYLDKLDVASKWVVITRLTTGKDFPRESKAFEDLRMLIKARNDFIHPKSIPFPHGDTKDFITKAGPKMKKGFEIEKHFTRISPYEVVIEVLTELRKLEGEVEIGTQWWQLEEIEEEK
jgi:hypothetical protein